MALPVNRKYQKYTRIFLGIAAVVIIAYDIWVATKGNGTTISHEIMVWSHYYPAIAFAAGFLCGHLFWPIQQTEDIEKVMEREL